MMPNMDGLELTKRLREDPTTSSVSVILLGARPVRGQARGFAVGADDYIVKPFDTPELLARIRGVLRRAKEMRAQSPLTGLPGNVRIEEEIERRVAERQVFAILYVDLDHFKSYNDHYGFMRGDQVIQFASRLLQDVAVDIAGRMRSWATSGATTSSSFAGASTRSLSRRPVARFDADIQVLYDDADRERGYIEVENRRGEPQRFPLVSISIGIATTERRRFEHYAEAVAIATEMKSFTKSHDGSWAVDRRLD